KKSRGTSRIVTDAITIQNPRNRGGSTGHVLAKRSVTFTEIRTLLSRQHHVCSNQPDKFHSVGAQRKILRFTPRSPLLKRSIPDPLKRDNPS
ncbi:hypothetical protein, partial [Pseudomonas aeruginosa]|uniref:hypothetical protein n=1 Tax=Pseudomonas aeruginosa TaxID=287 RepID=UPI001AEBD18B